MMIVQTISKYYYYNYVVPCSIAKKSVCMYECSIVLFLQVYLYVAYTLTNLNCDQLTHMQRVLHVCQNQLHYFSKEVLLLDLVHKFSDDEIFIAAS